MNENLLDLTKQVVAAYVSNNSVRPEGLPALIADVAATLTKLSQPATVEPPAPVPAVNPKRSVFPDYIICLEDGKKFKSLRRHLGVHYDLTPEQYREKWGLPHDYPMVAPSYSAARSTLAKAIGLGDRRHRAAASASPSSKGRKAATNGKSAAVEVSVPVKASKATGAQVAKPTKRRSKVAAE